MKIYSLIKNKIFKNQIEKERQKAQKLYDTKQNIVICKYCGQLLNKQEAGSVYDFKSKELEFFHDECFDKNEYSGTLEDLRKMASDEKRGRNNMNVKDVIKRLKELEKKLGNVEVEMYMEDIDGTQLGVDEINEIDISTDGEGLNPAIYIAHRNK